MKPILFFFLLIWFVLNFDVNLFKFMSLMYFYILYLLKFFSVIYCNILRLNFDEVRKLCSFFRRRFQNIVLNYFLRISEKSFPITQVLPNVVSTHANFLRTLPGDFPIVIPRVSSRAMWIPPPHLILKSILMVSCLRRKRKLALGL